MNEETTFASVPMRWVGPMLLDGESIEVPLATYESPLWPSVGRGARVSTHCAATGGITTTLIDERMTRSVLVAAPNAVAAKHVIDALASRHDELQTVVATTSRFAKLLAVNPQLVGNQLFLRFEFTTGDASGHNMVTKASEALLNWLLGAFPELTYGSLSGNACTDKKVSAVNGLLGRGKHVIAELTIPEKIVRKFLKTDAALLTDLNIRKNYVGSTVAGSLRSANAHVANMLLAFYLATGQDAANIVEGSQALVWSEDRDGDLYFSLTLPNLIVGTVGNGKGLDFVTNALERLGCASNGQTDREPGENAQRLARICAATALCGELSLLAALTNPGELMAAHMKWER